MKQITLCIVGLLSIFSVQAQGYQLPNNNFNAWSGNIPTSWNTFSAAKCDLGGMAALGCNTAKGNHHSQEAGRSGEAGDYSVRLYSTKVVGVVANGTLTTGRIRIGSTTATNSGNYNFSERGANANRAPFTASPDSLSVWVKMTAANNNTRARISVYIHGDSDFKDPNDAANKANYSGHTAAVVAPTSTWTQVKQPFTYDGTSSRNYMLVTLTTNETPGAGAANDALFIDDFELIYSSWLSTIRLDGAQIEGFDKGTLNYAINLATETTPTPEVTALAEASDASVAVVKSSISEISDLYTITVTAEDGSTKTYTVTFVRPAMREISIASAGNGTVQYISGVTADGTYTTGISVTVKATPEFAYEFVNWTKDGIAVSTDATYTFVHGGTDNLVANFAPKQYCTSFPNYTHESNRTLTRIVSVNAQKNVDFTVLTTGRNEILNKSMYINSWKPSVEYNTIKVYPGTTFSLKFSHNDTGWVRMYTFVDWNQDKEFNFTGNVPDNNFIPNGEFVVRNTVRDGSSEAWGNGTNTYAIAVPEDAKVGKTRIRVVCGWSVGDGACAAPLPAGVTVIDPGTNVVDFVVEVLDPNQAPTIESFNVPTSVTQNVPFAITGKAVDSDGTINSVVLYRNGTQVQTANTAEFSFTVNEPTVVSSVLFYVIATDNKGATVQSETRTIGTITNLEQSTDNRAVYASEGNIIVKGATGTIQIATSLGMFFTIEAEETTVISGLASGQLILITANGVTTKIML